MDYCWTLTLKYCIRFNNFFKNKNVSERKNQCFKYFSLNQNFTRIYTFLIMMLILMSRHLMIKKHFPRSLLFCCGLLVKNWRLPLPRHPPKVAEMAEFKLCASSVWGQEGGFNPNFLSNRMDDGCVETSSLSPAEPCVFCARAEDWFSDPAFSSFLPHRGLKDLEKKTPPTFFLISCNQYLNCLNFYTVSGKLACFVCSHLCFPAMSLQKSAWNGCPLHPPLC